jgi:hydrogenase-4 component B
MSEWLVVAAIVLSGASGAAGLLGGRRSTAGERASALAMFAAGACGLVAGFAGLVRGGEPGLLQAAWPVPGGRFALQVDPLSALFVVQISLIAPLGSLYGLGYWAQREHPENGARLRACYGIVVAGMLLLVAARNAVLFLVGWEAMALAAFLAITTEDGKRAVREAGYLYLVATRFGTLCLFAMFGLLFATSGTFEFDGWSRAMGSPLADAVFVLALLGFGLKAGVMPLHVWLPGAHANAPSHVSALLSGVLIKMGIYGIARITSLCALPPPWWGHVLVGLGIVSAVLGVAFALGQHDLKRLLAYHSVENIGIICIGLGVALLGRSLGRSDLVALGLAGALLHTWNHGLFKALLFLSAGAVLHATGTRDLDRLGGLSRQMPRTALAFLVGAVAICGLPPLNGLVSELLVYLGLFRLVAEAGGRAWLAGALAAPALALVGALAVACFVKAFGTVFLGAPRSGATAGAREVGAAMLAPMGVLAACCFAIGLGAPLVVPLLGPAVRSWSGEPLAPSLAELAPLTSVAVASASILAACALLGAWLALRTRGAAGAVGTWDCGYAAPGPRMQYSSSSFAETLVRLFSWALRPEATELRLREAFPRPAAFRSHVPDTVLDRVLLPGFRAADRILGWLRLLQRGSVHLYLVYVVATVVALLLWG